MKKIIALVLLTLTLVFTSACSCKKEETLTREQYSEAFSSVSDVLLKKESVSFLGYVNSSESADRNYLYLGVYMIFLEEAVKNDAFTVLNEGVGRLVSTARFNAINDVQEIEMGAYVKIRYSDNKIKTDLYVESDTEGELYLLVDIDYDFENSTLTSFSIYYKQTINCSETEFHHYKGDNQNVYVLEDIEDDDYTSAINTVSYRENKFSEEVENSKDIGDYSSEYSIAMIEQLNFVHGDGFASPVE